MILSEGLLQLWHSTGIFNMIEKADPTITSAFEQFLHIEHFVSFFLLLQIDLSLQFLQVGQIGKVFTFFFVFIVYVPTVIPFECCI